MRKRLGAQGRVGTDWELPWDDVVNGDVTKFDGDSDDQVYVYGWQVIFPEAKKFLAETAALLDADEQPVVPPVVGHDMCHAVEGIIVGATTKDGNKNLLVVSISMFAGETERKETWDLHYRFLLNGFGAAMNNKHSTGVMDENVSAMRGLAVILSEIELQRCAEHRGITMARGGSKGDKNRFMQFAAAPTIEIQQKLLRGCSASLREKILKVALHEQSLASKTRPGYGETMSNQIESTWHMIYAVRRANIAKALITLIRLHDSRRASNCFEAGCGGVA
jgi:hypothetical protein